MIEHEFSQILLKGKDAIETGWQRYCTEFREIPPGAANGHNVGNCCGPASGILVLDIDNPDLFFQVCREKGWEVPTTFEVETFKGAHHYYQYPTDGRAYANRARKKLGFDVRGVGGYVVAPGSIHPESGNPYRVVNDIPFTPAPQWLRDLSREEPKPKSEPPPGGTYAAWDGDIDRLLIRPETKALIHNGKEKGARSEAIMTVLNALVYANLADADIFQIFEQYPIGEKYHEKGRGREKWLQPQIDKARARVTDRADYAQRDSQSGQTAPGPEPEAIPARGNLEITDSEWTQSKLNPRCIVRDYIYADVAVLAAPGGTGKTTIKLYELIHIILGRDLYGLETVSPGWCMYVTAEDSREILIARTREVAKGMGLSEKEISIVKRDLIFWDVSGRDLKLIQARDGNILQTDMAGEIVEAFKSDPPAIVVFDPLVSFGASEAKVNDNEQGIISAGRRIRNGLSCAVFFVAHTGQAVAREKTLDQYSSRGGTALPDGSRMTSVMQPWTPTDTKHKPPVGCKATPDASITILARPKLSFAKPNLPLIWIRRTGWEFEAFIEATLTAEEKDRALMAQVETFVASAVAEGKRYTKTDLESEYSTMGMTRQSLRDIRNRLLACGRLVIRPLPTDQQRNNRKDYVSTPD